MLNIPETLWWMRPVFLLISLATTYLNHLQQNFTKYLTSAGNNSSGNDSLTDFNAEPANAAVAAAQGVSLQIAQPEFQH